VAAHTAPDQQADGVRCTGPIVIAFNGSPAGERALREAARLFAERRVLVLAVWKAGLGFEMLTTPAAEGLPPAPVAIRAALEIGETQYENAQRLAGQGAALARDLGLDADALVVAEDPEIPVSDTVVRIARERGSSVVVVGERAHGRRGEVFLGDTCRDVIRYAACPVVVVRQRYRTSSSERRAARSETERRRAVDGIRRGRPPLGRGPSRVDRCT
jgi:nucleotide-binding universal stress UspA family protein